MALTTSNISISAVNSALNAGTTRLSNLCTHANINKWSKCKPFRSSQASYTYSDLLTALSAANYGLSATASSNYNTAAQNGWVYAKPTSGYAYRLGDFRGYNHSALAPISAGKTLRVSRDSANATLTFAVNVSGANDRIGLSELVSLQNYYLALIINASGVNYIVTAGSKLSQSDAGTINIQTNVAPFNVSGSYSYTAVAANVISTTPRLLSTYSGTSYLPLPFPSTSDAFGELIVSKTATTLTFSVTTLLDNTSLVSATIQAQLNGTLQSGLSLDFNGIAIKKNGQTNFVNYAFSQATQKIIAAGTTSQSAYFTVTPSNLPAIESGDEIKAYANPTTIGAWTGTTIYNNEII